jgi:cytochrome P450
MLASLPNRHDAMKKSRIDLSYREAPDASALAHIPGSEGLPFIGRAIDAGRDLHGMVERQVRTFGPVSRFNLLGRPGLLVTGADLFQRIFQNTEDEFSAEKGYERSFEGFYPGGLVMMDFDVHRVQRRLLQGAFMVGARQRYLEMMLPLIAARVLAWGDRPNFHFFTNIKPLLLEIAACCFLGIRHMGPEADVVNHKFLELNGGMAALLRFELPFGAYGRGKRARRWLGRWFETMIAARRGGDGGDGGDVLSHMCRETDEEGQPYTARQIADHIIFLLFAAHDTAASALTHLAMYLGRDPALQQRLREHLASFGSAPLSHADLGRMDLVECCFHEVLRLHPPGPLVLRRTIRATELGGLAVPPHTVLYLPMMANHRDPRWWTEPERFDPDRFAPPRSEQRRHPMCFHPFGSGAHKCIGLHFADMLVKAFLHRFVQAFTFTTPPDYAPRLEWLPLPKPADGVPLTLTPRHPADPDAKTIDAS